LHAATKVEKYVIILVNDVADERNLYLPFAWCQ